MVADVVDVLVIGAGAAGAASAWRLARHGIGVTCLEQGDWPTELPATDPLWKRRRIADASPNPNVRGAPADYPVEDDASPIRPLMWNGVGGSTVMWSRTCRACIPPISGCARWTASAPTGRSITANWRPITR